MDLAEAPTACTARARGSAAWGGPPPPGHGTAPFGQRAMSAVLRDLAAVVGAVLVVLAGTSVVGTVVVPRPVGSRLTAFADWLVDRVFRGLERLVQDPQRRDEVLAARAASVLMMQLTV